MFTGIEGWVPTKRTSSVVEFLKDVKVSPCTAPSRKPSPAPIPPAPSGLPLPKPKITMTPEEEARYIQHELQHDENFPEGIPVQDTIGKCTLMCPQHYARDHEAVPLLNSYAQNGCPVDCGPDWTREQIELLLVRGPHRSAKGKDAIKQLREETLKKIEQGYARKVRWGDIKDKIPAKLKISPVAMIPHKSKKYRCILDLSFTLFHLGKTFASVNDTTTKKANEVAMVQLGLTLKRIVATMADNYDRTKPFSFAKLDIKDGFWRMAVNNTDAWNFCYVLPSQKTHESIDDIELVVPNSLQMGWCESPPLFCSGTETARDVIDSLLEDPSLPAHKFEASMLKGIALDEIVQLEDYVTIFEVFVDDFIGVTNNLNPSHLQQASRAMLHGIHSIFPPPKITGHNGFDPISESKLHKGDGIWSTKKEILGWLFDGSEFTLTLPASKCQKIRSLIKKILKMSRCSLKKYQKLAGKLQHASYGIPGGTGLFTPIQMAMAGNPLFINLTPDLKQALEDWRYFIRYLEKNPTSVLQLISNYPDYIGYCDACGLGVGGCWASGLKEIHPFLWHLEWPDDIKAKLITESNPSGTLTINDLELAGAVLQFLALECQEINLEYHHIGIFCDNVSAVSWAFKLRTSKSLVAGRLLRLLGLRIHARKASSIIPLSIAGSDNEMADMVSRAFKHGKYFEFQNNLTSYFNLKFPLPKQQSWQEFTLPTTLTMRVICCLRGEQLDLGSLIKLPGLSPNTGNCGVSTPQGADSTPSSAISMMNSNATASSSVLLGGSGQALTVEDIKSKFRASRRRSRPSPRPLSWLDNEVPSTEHHKNIT